MGLSWTNSGGGVVYDVYRNELGCNSGFTKIANNVAGTSFTDTGVANGFTYYYQVGVAPERQRGLRLGALAPASR